MYVLNNKINMHLEDNFQLYILDNGVMNKEEETDIVVPTGCD